MLLFDLLILNIQNKMKLGQNIESYAATSLVHVFRVFRVSRVLHVVVSRVFATHTDRV